MEMTLEYSDYNYQFYFNLWHEFYFDSLKALIKVLHDMSTSPLLSDFKVFEQGD